MSRGSVKGGTWVSCGSATGGTWVSRGSASGETWVSHGSVTELVRVSREISDLTVGRCDNRKVDQSSSTGR